IFSELRPVACVEAALQPLDLVAHSVEQAALFLHALEATNGIGGAAVTNQSFEDGSRIRFHRQRSRGATPADCVGVRARVTRTTGADIVVELEGKLQGSQLRMLSRLLRGDLVYGNAGEQIRTLRAFGR